jgi:hypothetical protein
MVIQLSDMGAALMGQVKITANRGVQHYCYSFYVASWQDNPAGKGYLT